MEGATEEWKSVKGKSRIDGPSRRPVLAFAMEIDGSIRGRQAWVREDLAEDDWLVPLDGPCLAELRRALEQIRTRPLPLLLLGPDDFGLKACAEMMGGVRRILDEGVGFAILDRLPLAEMDRAEATALFWLLATQVSRPVAQKLDGTMVYDVLDTGLNADAGTEVRPDKTSTEIAFHNDNAYNETPPRYTALLCLQAAKSGPLSRVLSAATLHNSLLARHEAALARLYEPFWFDRVAEHRADEARVFAAPVFARGEAGVRMALHQLRNGYQLKGEPLDSRGREAVEAVERVFTEPRLWVEFFFERGQLQFLNNRTMLHSRTAFTDHAEPEQRRHVVRLWLRDEGHRAYPG